MFDCAPDADNGVEREGACAYWRKITELMVNASERNRMLMFIATHEVGHTFNLEHTWGSCGWQFTPPNCTGLQSIMTYSFAYVENGRLAGQCSMHFNGSTFHSPYGTAENPSQLRFFQMGPESWVKSGKYGCPFPTNSTSNPPSFQDYQ